MVRSSLGVEPYEGKQLEDQNGPIDATLKTDPYRRTPPVPTPAEWVLLLVGNSRSFQDSMRYHHKVESAEPVRRAAVLQRWLLNGDQGLQTKADADIVLDALQRSPADPVDPVETEQVKRARDAQLALTRARVTARKARLS